MPSLQTLFRAAVMVGVGMVGIKAWQFYGPTNEQLRAAVTQAVDRVQSALHSRQQASASAEPDPRLAAPHPKNANQPAPPIAAAPLLAPQSSASIQTEAPKLLPGTSGPAASSIQASSTTPAERPGQSLAVGDRMPELMTRLEQLGAADTNLTPWGSAGKLYRFSCRAPLASAPTMTQHFESVAEEPVAAVEQVVAKVEAWSVAQRNGGLLR